MKLKRRSLLASGVGLSLPLAASSVFSAQAPSSATAIPSAPSTPPSTAPPVVLTGTAAHDVVDKATGRQYPIWVALPASYQDPEKARHAYPVVMATDAPWSFPYLRTLRGLVGRRGQNIEDFLLVGLGPAQGDSHMHSRSRDYTPSDPKRRPNRGDDYSSPAYGEADKHQQFVQQQVLPLIAQQYRANLQRAVFIGHSYGALFGLHTMLTQPSTYTHYILGSPSLWFDRRIMFEHEAEFAKTHRNLPAKVMMAAGGFETFGPTPRHYKDTDLVGNMKAFARQINSRRYPSLTLQTQVVSDEDHFTVFPSIAARGLTWALPGSGPYLSG